MNAIDITTAAGIAAIASFLIQLIKNIYKNKKKQIFGDDRWEKITIIILIAVLCIIISILAYLAGMIESDSLSEAFIRGFQAIFIAIGGYEGLKHFFNLDSIEKTNANDVTKLEE